MCEPTTLAVTALVVAGIGTAAGTVGSIQQGRAAQAAADFEADIAEQNAKTAESLAQDAENRGIETELDFREQVRARIRNQRAALARNNVLVDDDSAADLVTETAVLGEADAQTIRQNTAREAFGFRSQGAQFLQSAELARTRGDNARIAGIFGAAESLTTGTANILGGASRVPKRKKKDS